MVMGSDEKEGKQSIGCFLSLGKGLRMMGSNFILLHFVCTYIYNQSFCVCYALYAYVYEGKKSLYLACNLLVGLLHWCRRSRFGALQPAEYLITTRSYTARCRDH